LFLQIGPLVNCNREVKLIPGGPPEVTTFPPNCVFDKSVGSTCVIRTLRVLDEGEEAFVDYGTGAIEKMFFSGIGSDSDPDVTSVGAAIATATSVEGSSRSKRPTNSDGEVALSKPIKRNRQLEKLSAARSELRRLL
jgi:hypothetical protein